MAVKQTNFEFIKRYDDRNNEIYYKTSDGIEQHKTYDINNNLIYIKDITNKKETWIQYDDKNRIVSKRNSSGYAEFFDYSDETCTTFYRNTKGEYRHTKVDTNGNILSVLTNNGDTYYTYNSKGKCIIKELKNTLLKNCKTIYEYDENGNLIRTSNSIGHFELFSYDNLNHLVKSENSYGLIVEYNYDSDGNKIYEKNCASKIETYYSYVFINGKYLLSSIIDTNGRQEKYEYDENGNKIKYYESVFEKTYEYDKNNNLIHYIRRYDKEKG